MEEAAILAVWLIGLFGLIGVVMAAVARFVRRDSMNYDRQITWIGFAEWADREKEAAGKRKK